MDQAKIEKMVDKFRKTVCDINNKEVAVVLKLCRRKMELSGKEESYLEFFLPDELKNYCLRRSLNAISLSKNIRQEGGMKIWQYSSRLA